MRTLLACLLLAAAGCGSSTPASVVTPCPTQKQYCVVDSDAGCTILKLTCCNSEVPACGGTYSAANSSACAALPTQGCN